MTSENGSSILAFDVGGTNTRMAVFSSHLSIVEADSVATRDLAINGTPQTSIVAHLARWASERPDLHISGVSIGAAYNARQNVVIASAPLLGATAPDRWDVEGALTSRWPQSAWSVLNDLTAAGLGVLHRTSERTRDVLVITLSSGVAARLIRRNGPAVAVDDRWGIAGDVGHLPARFSLNGSSFALPCDCGGVGHLASYISGRGFERVLAQFDSGTTSLESFVGRLNLGDVIAERLLRASIAPLFEFLEIAVTLLPDVDIALIGGFHAALSDHIIRILQELSEKSGPYLLANDDDWLTRRLIPVEPTGNELLGAALYASRSELREELHRW